MSRHAVRMFIYVLFFVLAAGITAMAQVEPKAATEATKKANAAVLNQLPFADKQDFEDANRGYRWVAEVMNQVVFADPDNKAARELGADALEQLGYQAESGTWRNNFLQGALELRNGVPDIHIPGVAAPDVVQAMTPDMLLDYMGIRLSSEKADGKVSNIIWKDPGTGESYALELQNSVLIYTKGKTLANPDATTSMSRSEFADVLMGGKTIDDALASENVTVEGNRESGSALFRMLDDFPLMFNIVTP